MQNNMDILENSLQFLTKLNIALLYDPAVMLLEIYLNKLKMYSLLSQLMNSSAFFLYLISNPLQQQCFIAQNQYGASS